MPSALAAKPCRGAARDETEEIVQPLAKDMCIQWREHEVRFLIQVTISGRVICKSVRPATTLPEDVERAPLRGVRVHDALDLVSREAAQDPKLDVTDLVAQALKLP